MSSVRRPRSQSSFAAQPPLIPEPMTMASKSMAPVSVERGGAADFAERQAGAPCAGHQLEAQLARRADFGVVVADQHQPLELAIGAVVRGDSRGVEFPEHDEAAFRRHFEKAHAEPAPRLLLDGL